MKPSERIVEILKEFSVANKIADVPTAIIRYLDEQYEVTHPCHCVDKRKCEGHVRFDGDWAPKTI